MEGIVLTHHLSDRSLFYLDQAPVLKKKDFVEILDHINFLESFEKKVFLKYLEKGNIDIVKEYNKIKKKNDELIQKIHEEKRRKRQEEDNKHKEEYRKKWNDEFFLNAVREIIPNYCGLQFEENFRYYKFLDFSDSIYTTYDILSMGYEIRIALPPFFDFIKSFKENENIPIFSQHSETRYIMCYSEKTREEYLQNLHKRNKVRDKENGANGFKKI